MKKLLFILLIAVAFLGCKENEPVPFKFDPNAKIMLRGEDNVKSIITGSTPLEVVQTAINIKWQSHYFSNNYYEVPYDIARTFSESDRDFDIPALLMRGTDIISQEGEYYRDFIYAFNVYITDNNNDSIAYVSDQVITQARALIEEAYNNEDYSEVYRIFNEAFTFLPL